MDFLMKYSNALLEEYYFLSKTRTKIPLYDGKFLYEEKDWFVYSFTTSKEICIPDGTPIQVYTSFSSYLGSIVYAESYEIVLRVKNRLDLVSKIEFSSAVHELIKALVDKLSFIDYNNTLVNMLVNGAYYHSSETDIKKGQETAYKTSIEKPITIIWGPPGTGKTYTLSNIALHFYKQEKSVLIVSQSNIAVDNAMLKIKELILEDASITNPEGKIFRAGYSKIKGIASINGKRDFYINSREYIKKTNPQIIEQLEELNRIKNKEQDKKKLKEINDSIKAIRGYIHSVEENLIYNARLLGTTISKATVDNQIAGRKYDVVLFDEASMAYVPQIIYACSLAKSHFICIGDFRQLPPIVQCNEENILNRDIFDYLGIYINKLRNHEWLVMLNEQRRMNPLITEFIKKQIYSNQLVDFKGYVHDNWVDMFVSTNSIKSKGPIKNEVLGYFDMDIISSTTMIKEVGKTFSHSNLVSAYISVLIAIKAKNERQESIAILSPYKNQVNLIKSILRDLNIGQDEGVFCSTIHQFQGRESDLVIFDTVDATPLRKVGKMMVSGDNSIRLINVAITRAKGKFVVVGSHSLGSMNYPLNKLWEYIIDKGKPIQLKEIFNFEKYDLFTETIKQKIKKYDNLAMIVNQISTNKKMVIASFNSDVIDYQDVFFEILNRIPLSNRDYVFIDKNIDDIKLQYIAKKVNSFISLNIGFKSISYSCDNLLLTNGKNVYIPIILKKKKACIIICHKGEYLLKSIIDYQYEQLVAETKVRTSIKKVTEIKPKEMVQCPICLLKQMPLGDERCPVCAKHVQNGKTLVSEENRVTLRDISNLWASLLGERNLAMFWFEHIKDLRNVITNNYKISRVRDIASWRKGGKDYYYNKNDVFKEFFLSVEKVREAIVKCGIRSYSELERNIIYVSNKIH